MKKLLLFMIITIGGGGISFGANSEVPMEIIKHGGAAGGSTLAPPRPWYIIQDDNVLTLPVLADDYLLELRSEDGEVVYTTYVPTGTTMVTLPSTLSGDFELRLVADTYYYRGYISL